MYHNCRMFCRVFCGGLSCQISRPNMIIDAGFFDHDVGPKWGSIKEHFQPPVGRRFSQITESLIGHESDSGLWESDPAGPMVRVSASAPNTPYGLAPTTDTSRLAQTVGNQVSSQEDGLFFRLSAGSCCQQANFLMNRLQVLSHQVSVSPRHLQTRMPKHLL
jgi:hypothetical protein